MERQRRSYVADCLLLMALCLLFFWRDLTPITVDQRQFKVGDFSSEFYASAHYAASRLATGQLPLWSPYNNVGHPFLADPQVAVPSTPNNRAHLS